MESPASAVPRPTSPDRSALPITTTAPVKRERRWSVAALSIVLAVLCALGAVWAVNSASSRTKVLAVARDVPVGQVLTASDVTVAEVSADAALSPMPASDKTSVLGRRTAVDLRQGGLLLASQLAAGTGLGDDQQQVGVLVKRGQAPVGTLASGDKVLAVTVPAPGTTTDVKNDTGDSPIEAMVVSVSRPDASGAVVVNLAAGASDGPVLASRASQGRIALVREPRSK